MDKIYILKKRKIIHGPYTLEALKNKGLRYNDLAWYNGLEDWTPVDKVEIFNDVKKRRSSSSNGTFLDRVFGFLK